MKYKENNIDSVEEILETLNIQILHKTKFPISEKRLLDYIAKRGGDVTVIKLLKEICTSSSIFRELKKLLNLLKLNALLIADKINSESIVEGVLHIRDRVGIVQFKTIQNIAKGESVYVYEYKGMYYVKIDGKKLRELRLRKRYSLGELAKAIGISIKALQKYEDEAIDMSIEKAHRFIEIFGEDFVETLKEVDLFNHRIIDTVKKTYATLIKEEDRHRYRLLSKLISQGIDEVELFNYFSSDIIFSKKGIKVFVSLINDEMDPDTAILKAKENMTISQLLNGVPVNVVNGRIPNNVTRELEEYGTVYKYEDVDKYGIDLE